MTPTTSPLEILVIVALYVVYMKICSAINQKYDVEKNALPAFG